MKWTDLLARYIRYLALEKGLADNTLFSYENDLQRYIHYLDSRKIQTPSQISLIILQEYIGKLYDIGLASSSLARNFSAIRGFHQFLIANNLSQTDPSELLETPRQKRSLPQVLSVEEITGIITQPDTESILGIRDRAMLEVMYGCGLRVSELLTMKLNNLLLSEGLLRIMGKGSKERFSPIGDEAVHWLNVYLGRARPPLTKGGHSKNIVFLNK